MTKFLKQLLWQLIETSAELAKERGSFPFLQGETEEETNRLRQAFINTGFMKKMAPQIFVKRLLKMEFATLTY